VICSVPLAVFLWFLFGLEVPEATIGKVLEDALTTGADDEKVEEPEKPQVSGT